MTYKPDLDDIVPLANQLLSKSADWLAWAGAKEQFYFVSDCQRVIKGLLANLPEKRPCPTKTTKSS